MFEMTTRSEILFLAAYAEPFSAGDPRAVAAVNGFERAFPQVRLAWKLVDPGRPVALPDRDAWLKAHTGDGAFSLLCNDDESYATSISGYYTSPISGPGGHAESDVHLRIPLDEATAAAGPDILEAIADGIQAFWGTASPGKTASGLALQTIHPPVPGHPLPPPPGGLPGVWRDCDLPSPVIPGILGWLNYWSPAAADTIRFPDPSRDADLLARARRTRAGAWIVQLTDAPLDLNNPAHIDTLHRMYDRFPAIGGRDLDLPLPEY